ncbi:MAG: hypothetical protein WCI64_12430, partial [Chlorobium sp.]
NTYKMSYKDLLSQQPDTSVKMNEYTAIGLKPLDALHIACAVSLQCQYFLTVDKGILKKATEFPEIKVTNPVNFIIERGN